MGVKEMYELEPPRQRRPRTHRLGCAAIVVCQNVLLWLAFYVIASTIYILVVGAVNLQNIPSAVMYLVASILSLFYLGLQNFAVHLRTSARSMVQHEKVDSYQSLAAHTLPILFTMWTIASGLCVTFTAARQPLCSSAQSAAILDRGHTCIINRTTIIAGLVGVIATIMLCILRRHVDEANRCHLLGVIPEDKLLPLFLPHKRGTLRAQPSEMSFKCRSSVSIASQATVSLLRDRGIATASLDSLVPCRPQGPGIQSSRASAPASLLRPRPSLSSIRSHASLPLPLPPASPLPPLPAYLPAAIRATTVMHKAIYPPMSFSRPAPARSARSDTILQILQPPAPVLSQENVAMLARRPDSVSSIYSRETNGGDSEVIPRMSSRPSLTSSSRTTSSSSIVTMKRSPLHMMTLPGGSQEQHISKMSDTSSEGSQRRRTRSLGSSVESIAPLHIRKSSMPNKLEEKLRRYAESQSQIRKMGYKPLMQNTMGCPEKFRFE